MNIDYSSTQPPPKFPQTPEHTSKIENDKTDELEETSPEELELQQKMEKVRTFVENHREEFSSLLEQGKTKHTFSPTEHDDLPFKLILTKEKDGSPIVLMITPEPFREGKFKSVFLREDLLGQHPKVRTKEIHPNITSMRTELSILLDPKLQNSKYVATALKGQIKPLGSASNEFKSYLMKTQQKVADGDLSEVGPQAPYLLCMRDGAYGLAELHRNGIIHCDVKSRNFLLFQKEATTKISDFGTAVIKNSSDPQVRKEFEMGGTPDYMPPEGIQYIQESFEILQNQAKIDTIKSMYKEVVEINSQIGKVDNQELENAIKKLQESEEYYELESQLRETYEIELRDLPLVSLDLSKVNLEDLPLIKTLNIQVNSGYNTLTTLNNSIDTPFDIWSFGTDLYLRAGVSLLHGEDFDYFYDQGEGSPWIDVENTAIGPKVSLNEENLTKTKEVLLGKAEELSEKEPSNAALLKLIVKTLEIDPAERPTADQVAQELDRIQKLGI